MACDGMRDLMSQHNGQRGFILCYGKQAGINHHFSARHTPGIHLRVFHRLGALLASLALLGYGLSAATGGDLLRSCSSLSQCGADHSAVTLPEHVYFSLIAFFNGFSDLQLVHSVVGYAYLFTVVVSFVAVVYFFVTDAIASQSEFRANMRAAAESFVLQQSSL